jgi:hypothetical protein
MLLIQSSTATATACKQARHAAGAAAAQHVSHLTDFLLKALAAVVESTLEAVGCCVLEAFLRVNTASSATECQQPPPVQT